MDEFELIKTIFHPLQHPAGEGDKSADSFLMKIGDDAAVWKGQGNLAFSIDTLVEGVHFTPDIPPKDLGYRVLAVNLSDLAAMSATPQFFTLAITLPSCQSEWLKLFALGMKELVDQYQIPLVGGDTTKGPLTITIQAHGLTANPVYRSGAQVGDDVYVSGCLGDAAAGLKLWLDGIRNPDSSDQCYLIERFHRPTPRIELGEALATVATAMLDVSDGLVADLSHVATASQCAIELDAGKLPLSESLLKAVDQNQAKTWALSGGDDYELAFTVPSSQRDVLKQISEELGVSLTRIGSVKSPGNANKNNANKNLVNVINGPEAIKTSGYNHFA